MDEFKGKVALVTGASRGIGEAAARAFAKAGAAVVLAARSQQSIDKIAGEISAAGGTAAACRCDVVQYADVAAAVDLAVNKFGRLDIMINNAGMIEPIARLANSDPEQWAHSADVNYKGVYHGLRAAIPVMEGQGSGVIINISSGAATGVLEGWSHYCSAKAAALSLTRCVDLEVRDKGIRIVGLSPGTVATEMQVQIKASGINPVSQLDPTVHISPDWVGQAIVWLATDAASEFSGVDVSLRDDDIRRRVGLPTS